MYAMQLISFVCKGLSCCAGHSHAVKATNVCTARARPNQGKGGPPASSADTRSRAGTRTGHIQRACHARTLRQEHSAVSGDPWDSMLLSASQGLASRGIHRGARVERCCTAQKAFQPEVYCGESAAGAQRRHGSSLGLRLVVEDAAQPSAFPVLLQKPVRVSQWCGHSRVVSKRQLARSRFGVLHASGAGTLFVLPCPRGRSYVRSGQPQQSGLWLGGKKARGVTDASWTFRAMASDTVAIACTIDRVHRLSATSLLSGDRRSAMTRRSAISLVH